LCCLLRLTGYSGIRRVMTTTKSASRTRKELVLAALKSARRGRLTIDGYEYRTKGGWVDGWLLTHPAIGGSEGLRRLRELRAQGERVEMRAHPDAALTTRQYRLKR
jgi:hypothetical protein